ncbi:MAG: helix-turn-helix domain-containing protein [Xenococcaceae cyanobacterium]
MAVITKMIRWRLKEVMARHDIKGKELAEELGVNESAVSNWRTSKTIPRIGGERIEEICGALSKLAKKKISFIELVEEVEELI